MRKKLLEIVKTHKELLVFLSLVNLTGYSVI